MSSATDNTATTPESASAKQLVSARPNPVAFETMINVTGARQTTAGRSRDLFSEDTTTVLVFPDGAVIRLDAGVAIGQLLFIKHKKSNAEVVCQVLRKRNYKPTSCYVELQFTEEKPDFWGVAFPEAKAGSPEFKLKEHLEAEETTADDQGGAVAPHSEAEVEKLRRELESLRQQLKTLEQQKAAEAVMTSAPVASSSPPTSPRQPALEVAAAVPAGKAACSAALPNLATDAAKAPWEKAPKTPPRPMVGMALPTQKNASEAPSAQTQDPIEALLPKPALDFSKLPQPQAGLARSSRTALPHANPKLLLLIGLGVIAFVAVGLAWWRHSQFTKSSQPSASASANIPKPSTASSSGSTPVLSGVKGLRPSPSSQSTTSASSARPQPASSSVVEVRPAQRPSHPGVTRSTRATGPALRSRSAANAPGSKPYSNQSLSSVQAVSASSIATADTSPADAASTPAKLLKAANPVYPPDAMRHYITGDVRTSILVDANGRVQNVEVLSGPQALRSAAIDALKQYLYSPATQSGKPVSSQLQVTVKFWFNP